MHQFLTHALGSCSPRTRDQIIGCCKVELMGSRETCVPCKGHHIMFTHAIGKPHTYGCPSKIVEGFLLDTGFSEDLIELPSKIVCDFESGISTHPLAFWPEHSLYVLIPFRRNENIGIPFRLLGSMIYEHLDSFVCQWACQR